MNSTLEPTQETKMPDQSTALAVVDGGRNGRELDVRRPAGAPTFQALVPTTYAEAAQLAGAFFRARLFQVPTEDAALTIIMTGMELGIAPATAMRGIYVIDGKPSLSADLMVAVLKGRPDVIARFDVLESNDKIARCVGRRRGSNTELEMEFTWEMAVKAGLSNKSTYKNYPGPMLLARCKSRLARALAEDLLLGLYTPDELTNGTLADDPPADVIYLNQPGQQQATPAAIAAVQADADELKREREAAYAAFQVLDDAGKSAAKEFREERFGRKLIELTLDETRDYRAFILAYKPAPVQAAPEADKAPPTAMTSAAASSSDTLAEQPATPPTSPVSNAKSMKEQSTKVDLRIATAEERKRFGISEATVSWTDWLQETFSLSNLDHVSNEQLEAVLVAMRLLDNDYFDPFVDDK